MFAQLNTGEINKGDIIKYYKTNYDPMLELHNNFFDKCLDHLVDQELKRNSSFFMKVVDKVKDLFSQGTSYDKLYIKDLGVHIECDNYINQTVNESYISKKKEELKNLKSTLININQPNARRMGRLSAENGNRNQNENNLTPAQIEEILRKKGVPADVINDTMKDISKGGLGNGAAAGNGAAGNASGSGAAGSGAGSASGQVSGGSSVNVSGQQTTTKGSISSTTQRQSSPSTKVESIRYDASGKVISDGDQSYNVKDGKYSGSTISGAGAKFSIFYDRKITKKDGKSYVEIGGVQHLIDEDGWIHGLNIDASDKNINYNIAYENYFDTSCESMLTFMKNKYKQLLADFNMNRDYVHNLQIENRRYIKKVETLTKENTEIQLKLNTCEQRITNEKVKKTTLYHNIKDIKRIKVDTRIKELQTTIINYEKTINNYKIEITNLKTIIKENKGKCDKDITDIRIKLGEECKRKTIEIENKCKIDIDVQIKKYTQCEQTNIQINLDLGKCREKNKKCEQSECSKQLDACRKEVTVLTSNITKINITLTNNIKEITILKQKIVKLELQITQLKVEINNCKGKIEICKRDQEDKKKCETEKIKIEKECKIEINKYKIEINTCNKIKIKSESDETALKTCKIELTQIKAKMELECKTQVTKINEECTNSKTDLEKQIISIKKLYEEIKITLEKIQTDFNQCSEEKKECKNELTVTIKKINETCDADKKKIEEKCQVDINIQIQKYEQCTKDSKDMEERKDKECSEKITTITKSVTEITQKWESCTSIKISLEQELDVCKTDKTNISNLYENCKSSNAELTVKITNLTEKNVKINCDDVTKVIKQEKEKCELQLKDITINYNTCTKVKISLNVEIEKYKKEIVTIKNDQDDKCEKKIVDIRKEEQKSCQVKIDVQIENITNIQKKYSVIFTQYNQCQKDLQECTVSKTCKVDLIKCQQDLVDQKRKYVDINIKYESQINIVNNLKIEITNITKKYNKCVNDKNTDSLKVELDACLKIKAEKIELIKTLKIYIDKSFIDFRYTIQELQLSYNSKLQKLIALINSTNNQSSTIKIVIENHTTKIETYNNDKEMYERQIKELKITIASLIKQRNELLSKLDTIDSTSITLISEIRQQITKIQIDIDSNNERITEMQILWKQVIKEIYKYQGELEVYKQNQEYYLEMIEKYKEMQTNMEKYIKKLEEIIKKKTTVPGKDDGTQIDISVYIKNIETQDKDIIFKLNNQIEKFDVQIKELQRQYNLEYKNFQELLKKAEESCKNRIAIITQEKNEMDEKCDKKIQVKITEINKQHSVTIIEIKANYRKEIIELKKKCNGTGISINNDTYNFELYKKHCLILIEKNTDKDCERINEIRTVYNEKCIMTALPTSNKDLTTFASSDFNDNRNALMMKRLDTKQ